MTQPDLFTDDATTELAMDGRDELVMSYIAVTGMAKDLKRRADNLREALLEAAGLGRKFGGEITERFVITLEGKPILTVTGMPGPWRVDGAKLKAYNAAFYNTMLKQGAGTFRIEPTTS